MTTGSEGTPITVPTNSRTQILKAAAAIVAERGYEGTTISMVVKQSGVPVSSVYWFFKGKDHLFTDVIAYAHEAWAAEQPDWVHPPLGTPLAEALPGMLRDVLLGLNAAPEFRRIMQILTLQNHALPTSISSLVRQLRSQEEDCIGAWFTTMLQIVPPGRRAAVASISPGS